MKILILIYFLVNAACFLSCTLQSDNTTQNTEKQTIKQATNNEDTIPPHIAKLIDNYGNFIISYKDNKLLMKDSVEIVYDDGIKKNFQSLLDEPDIEDMFLYPYSCDNNNFDSIPTSDPGRIRNIDFFKSVYGKDKETIAKNLTTVLWCPNLVGRKIRVNKLNGVSKKFEALSAELDQHPEFISFINDIGGTFNYRVISGTNRLSMHSFGITIDINVEMSNYWQWDCRCKNEEDVTGYLNKIPYELVKIFEKHGFIWGGRWKHYDTMHFEYRPELL